MTEQTPNEPRDLDAEIEWAVWMLTGTKNGKRVPLADFTRDRMVTLLAALRARPTLDREALARAMARASEPDLDWDNPSEYDLLDQETLLDHAGKILAYLEREPLELTIYTPSEAAKVLGVSRTHLYKILDSGALAHHVVGARDRRIVASDLFAYRARMFATQKCHAEIIASMDDLDDLALDEDNARDELSTPSERGPLTNTEEIKLYHVIEKVIVDELHVQKVGASDEVTSAAVDWFNSAILAAVGQDTPEPTPSFTVDTLLRGFGDHVRDGIGGCSCGWNQLGRSFSHHLTDSILAR